MSRFTKNSGKIWAGEYIELGELLLKKNGNPNTSFTISQSGDVPAVSMASQQKNVPIQYFGQWQSAFNIFVAIYAEKAPNETDQLMKYAETVR